MADFGGNLDLALLPVWGWGPTLGPGHLNPDRAARAAALLSPRLAVPIHWGTLYPPGLARLRPRPLSEPPREFAARARVLAPEVEVRVATPGEQVDFGPDR
jgi:L-ascorbate metabolism protein UlaG (beta-lactamase superfamily)